MPDEANKGWGNLPCPKCGVECLIHVDLLCVNESDSLHCCECDEDFGPEDVRNFVAKWQPVLAWLDTAPTMP